jgi:hypothetical protein
MRVRWLGIVGVMSALVSLWPLILQHRPLGPPSPALGPARVPRLAFWLGQAARAAAALFGLDWPFDI